MKQILLVLAFSLIMLPACKKDKNDDIPSNLPRTDVPAQLQGNWMYGNFSMTEYWSKDPSTYLGNGFEMAIAFKFFANGTYEQYFTSSTVVGGVKTYHQSLSKGTVEIDQSTSSIITHCSTAHYKQTKNGSTVEDRDLGSSEITRTSNYKYSEALENGTKVLLLTLNGNGNALKFFQKF